MHMCINLFLPLSCPAMSLLSDVFISLIHLKRSFTYDNITPCLSQSHNFFYFWLFCLSRALTLTLSPLLSFSFCFLWASSRWSTLITSTVTARYLSSNLPINAPFSSYIYWNIGNSLSRPFNFPFILFKGSYNRQV